MMSGRTDEAGRVGVRSWRRPLGAAGVLLLTAWGLHGCSNSQHERIDAPASAEASTPPVAAKHPVTRTAGGETFIDDYAWLRDRANPATIAYLVAENAYADRALAHTRALQEQLYTEMLSRIKEDDQSPPYWRKGYLYYTRTEPGSAYDFLCRRQGGPAGSEQVMLDENRLARGHEYFSLGLAAVSPDQGMLAFATDHNGSEKHRLKFKNLRSGTVLADTIESVAGDGAWANDDRHFFYLTYDDTMRPFRVWRHELGTPASRDEMVYEEGDGRYYLALSKTNSERYILIEASSMATTEVRFIDAEHPLGGVRVVQPRKEGVEYSVDHHGGAREAQREDERFFMLTNEGAINFKLMEAPIAGIAGGSWTTVLPNNDDMHLLGIDCFKDFMVLTARENGLPSIRVRSYYEQGPGRAVAFPEPTYTVSMAENAEFDTRAIRVRYSSPITPTTWYDVDAETLDKTVVKVKPVLGGYDPSKYEVRYLWAPAPDGRKVPVSVVMKKGLALDGGNPCWIYGYGSYGYSMDASFRSNLISMLDRGFVLATAHVRGGSELGRAWYEDGRLRNKKNSFTDFIAVAEFLVHEGYTRPEKLAAWGGSAGGLLMGAITNMRPDLFRAVVAIVPFVDVINTMLDPTIPLTVTEWEQWGDPRKPDDYAYMRSYSPYDNVEAKAYPSLLIMGGLNDPRVGYWEPAKWAARLRAMKTDGNLLLLKTNMGSGHGGATGRYDELKEDAMIYAFVIDALGANRDPS